MYCDLCTCDLCTCAYVSMCLNGVAYTSVLYGHGVHIKANSTMTHLRQGKEVAEHQVCVQVTVLHRQPDKNFFRCMFVNM